MQLSLKTVQERIFTIRGQRVMLDNDLAELYEIATGHLKRAVQRNRDRFPEDFMFQLNKEEFASLRCQFGISRFSHGGSRYLPYAFTQEGVAMLSGVLRSPKAVQVNIAIMRAFVQLRQLVTQTKELASKLDKLEQKVGKHDEEIQVLFKVIKELMAPPSEKPKKRIGFSLH